MRRTDRHLDVFGGPLTQEQIVLTSGVGNDVLIHLVARNANAARRHDAAEAGDGNLSGAAADVHDHAAVRLTYRKAGSDRCGHRLLDKADPTCTGSNGSVAHGTLLYFGDS